eukprot:TRINITY_DN6651_c0_g1_i1.p1 TRINITY_DN6651_c0_g1~~TRINITY_DN6651_c0_g1_i1.p1  ORF type:complete len:758 (-),score=164.01 TRINITY_DN6651_c0_g1_i1:35-2308(-)
MARKRMKEDYEILKKFRQQEGTYLRKIELEDDTLCFTVKLGNKTESYSLFCSDYPVATLFTDDGDPKEYTGHLYETVHAIVCELAKRIKAPPPHPIFQGTTSPLVDGDHQSSPKSNKKSSSSTNKSSSHPNKRRKAAKESSEEEDDRMDEDEYSQPTEDISEYKICEELLHDMEQMKSKHGVNSLTYRDYLGLDVIDVELHFDIGFLGEAISQAWGVDRAAPITIRVSLNPSMYLTAFSPPKIDILQITRAKCGLSSQLRNIMTEFVKTQWANKPDKLNRDPIQAKKTPNTTPQKGGKKDDKKKISLPKLVGRDNDIVQLMEMGFSIEQSTNACRLRDNLEEAINLLVTSPEQCTDEAVIKSQKQQLNSVKQSSSDTANPMSNLFENEAKTNSAKEAFNLNWSNGLLCLLLEYCLFRVPTLSNYCPICDRAHLFANGAMLKPAVCSRELCCFAFQQLGVMSDAADDIATEAEVVDLLVCMATAASKSARANDIFDPYPTLFDPENPKVSLFNPASKDFDKLRRVLKSFPTVQRMSQAASCVDMKTELDRADKSAYPLLQWILSSNRSHIVKIPKNKHLESMHTPFQYVLLSSAPEKQRAFDLLKKQHGSVFAFHGSRVENWHSILRNGLKNASGTKLQVNGAAYGSGIYLSPESSVSFGYSGIVAGGGQANRNRGGGGGGGADVRFLNSDNFFCIAICEVINHNSLRKSGSIWVMPDPEMVVTRFFFVYEISNVNVTTMPSCSNNQFVEQIHRALNK